MKSIFAPTNIETFSGKLFYNDNVHTVYKLLLRALISHQIKIEVSQEMNI